MDCGIFYQPINVLTSADFVRLMRHHGWTIRSLAARYEITMKRVREVRNSGVHGIIDANEWLRMLTGELAEEYVAWLRNR